MSFDDVAAFVDAAVGRVFPGAVLLVRARSRVFLRAFGFRSLEPEKSIMTEDTIFDLSSLTKPLATSVALMLLVREHRLSLDDRVTRFFPNFGVHGKGHVTFRHLLAHCSGLPAWRPYYKSILRAERKEGRLNFLGSREAREYVYEQIQRERPESVPGERALYSDLGFMMLGAAVEAISGTTLDRFCHERIFRPLALADTGFIEIGAARARRGLFSTARVAPTERCPWRKRVLHGEVHDDNAYAMGGVAGHAGLFSTARDVDALLNLLCRCARGEGDFVPACIVNEFWKRDSTVADSTWALGWDSPAPKSSAAGTRFSAHTIGHLGFTGTSFWMDLERERLVILLTNRVHPRRDNDAIREFRPELHDRVNEALDRAGW